MTPIERVSARGKALAILGLEGSPTKSEVRKMFRKLAFEKHPDQGNSTDEEFARISDAYHLLSELAADDAPASPKTSVSRPAVQPIETEFDAHTLGMCQGLLHEMETFATRHVSTRLYRKGRMLTYFVPTPAGCGLNQIALPTGDLVDARRIQAMSFDVWSGDICGNVFDVPAQQCARFFPGARSVQIRFGDPVHH